MIKPWVKVVFVSLGFLAGFYCEKAEDNMILSIDQGLSQSSVVSIAQDNKGFVWL